MTRARNGAASAAPARAVTWYALPFDEAPPKFAPACADGDEVLVRTTSGREVLCTVDRRRGCYFVDGDGDAVEADAIAHPPRVTRHGKHAGTHATHAIKARPTPEEKARWKAIAGDEGVALSDWIIEACRCYELIGKRKNGVLTDADWRRVVSG